jgi:hypothetical protein
MSQLVAWALLALGIAHCAYGLVKFKSPLIEAAAAGFVGQFKAPEARRAAFWFVIFGPLLVLTGHTSVHAVAVGDLALLKIVGIYLLILSLVGVAAYPKSPFWGGVLLSPLLIAAGYGWLL